MTPDSSINLERFLKDYEVCKKCRIATLSARGKLVTHLVTSGVVTRYAWEIDENDLEISAIALDDDVFIPEGVANPPIRRALAKISSFSRR